MNIQNFAPPHSTSVHDTLLSASQVLIMMSVKLGSTLVLAQSLLQLQCGWVTAPAMCFKHKLGKWTEGHKLTPLVSVWQAFCLI